MNKIEHWPMNNIKTLEDLNLGPSLYIEEDLLHVRSWQSDKIKEDGTEMQEWKGN